MVPAIFKERPILVGAMAVLATPICLPVLIPVCIPVAICTAVYFMYSTGGGPEASEKQSAVVSPAEAKPEAAKVEVAAPAASAAPPPFKPKTSAAASSPPPFKPKPKASAEAAAAPNPSSLTGSAAILARMKQSKDASSKASAPPPEPEVKPDADAGAKPAAPLSGGAALLAQMRAKKAAQAKPEPTPEAEDAPAGEVRGTINIFYGGEAATQISKDLEVELKKSGYAACLRSTETFKEAKLDKEPSVSLFIVETVENAQPAEAAGTCVRWYNRQKKKAEGEGTMFAGKLKYSVLCLGDTNLLLDRQTTTAKDCNQAGQALDNSLKFLGAERLCERGEANDAVGLEEGVDPWKERLLPALDKAFPALKSATEEDAAMKKLLVLYGSQTGNSAEIAKEFAGECPEHGIEATVMAMEETKFDKVMVPGVVTVVVVSSTGDGEPPDNCAKFYSQLGRRKNPPDLLKGVKYAVLGLGDQNYSAFMAVPRHFHIRMEECGATPFYRRGEADETEGLEEYVDQWKEGIWAPLKKALQEKDMNVPTKAAAAEAEDPEASDKKPKAKAPAASKALTEDKLMGVPALPVCRVALEWHQDGTAEAAQTAAPGASDYTVEAPFMATVVECKRLTATDSDRDVLHLALGIAGSGVKYSPGDSLGVMPSNDPDLVNKILTRLGLDGEKRFSVCAAEGQQTEMALLPHIRTPCSIRSAFAHSVDITTALRKTTLRVLAEHCSEQTERVQLLSLCSRGGRDDYSKEITIGQPGLLELLNQFPSCNPPLAPLLDALPKLNPRMYSLSCAQEENPEQAHVAFSVVNFTTPAGHTKAGVATNWIARSAGPRASTPVSTVPIFFKSGGQFAMPQDLSAPIIMVGPGTGVTPFRGFLQKRRAMLAASPPATAGAAWLFFGCRRAEEDYLYKEDLEEFAKDGTLTKLHVAFSREKAEKVYVQHLMEANGAALAGLVNSGAYFFVCGCAPNHPSEVPYRSPLP
ncbi:hypothetical protein CYMTET_16978 [Cymbomonas tetramitiformis]|uniref:Methionine synthase reductase n=1 Tax=Cymbomonas tetramitiformis TaxID=36881 RepID=A0AAE0GBF0_9CHLO|nr:hypothetical protein CYMTET_16978 [Cymbomonas tetramitiformis]